MGNLGDGSTPDARAVLHGRRSECAILDQTVAAVRVGESRVLVVRGEAGVGKTALLEYAVAAAHDLRILRVVGVESERELPFAALHQLCAPLLNRVQQLPAPQRVALETAFGLRDGPTPDRFVVGLAVLTLLSARAEAEPLLCVVDNAQWLDRASAQAFGFLARRLSAEPVAVLFGIREIRPEISGLPELAIDGLRNGDARALLDSAVPARLDRGVRDRIVAETRGNPLALIELPRGLTATQFAGGLGLLEAPGRPDRIEAGFVDRIGRLSPGARLLLLVAAAETDGDPLLIWRAADRLGLPVGEAAASVQAEDLLVLGDRAVFRDPLVRSGVYRAASAEDRRAVHRALAEAIDASVDPDRRAWHLATAATGPDEAVATELEVAAGRAQARGGLAAAAAFLQRAATLSEGGEGHGRRAIASARASIDAGEFDDARQSLATAKLGPLTDLESAEVEALTGRIAFAAGPDRDAPALLLAAARRLEPLDPERARETYLTAWGAAVSAGQSAGDRLLAEIGRSALAVPRPRGDPRPVDLLLESLALLAVEGRAAAAGKLRSVSRVFAAGDVAVTDVLHWGWAAIAASNAVWDVETTRAISLRQIEVVREIGTLRQLPVHLSGLSTATVWTGAFAEVSSLIAEADAVAAATGSHLAPYAELRLRALRGREADASELITATLERAAHGGPGLPATSAHWAAAVLHNGLGHFEIAASAAWRATTNTGEPWVSVWALPELIEAAVRLGDDHTAWDAMTRLTAATEPCGTEEALGVAARSRALVSEGPAAEDGYVEALERLAATALRPESARTALVYGEWLRRRGRRADARIQLRTAFDLFAAIGMEAFAERAGRELSATGEPMRRRTGEMAAKEELTPQERQIALLVRDGLSNPEVGARLFLSSRTVEWHLRKVFTKLAISSRRQLREVIDGRGGALRTRDA